MIDAAGAGRKEGAGSDKHGATIGTQWALFVSTVSRMDPLVRANTAGRRGPPASWNST